MTTTTPKRRGFYRSEVTSNIQITPRDTEILEAISKRGMMNADQIARLIKGSPEKIKRRVGELFYAGFLNRPPSQIEYYRVGGGSSKRVYSLSNEGARVLIEQRRIAPENFKNRDRNRKSSQVKRPHIQHTLAVADVAIQFVEAAPRHGLAVQLDDELRASLPDRTRSSPTPFKITVSVSDHGSRHTYSVTPDLAAAVIYPDATRRCFLVERCRGTMPVKRKNLYLPSIIKKALAYETARQHEVHKTLFNWRNFRVLFVTNGSERTQHILDELRQHPVLRYSPLFLVADVQSIAASHDLLSHPWQDCAGTTRPLI